MHSCTHALMHARTLAHVRIHAPGRTVVRGCVRDRVPAKLRARSAISARREHRGFPGFVQEAS
eukprot:4074882-Alexandrium_andersonii.AAC.1